MNLADLIDTNRFHGILALSDIHSMLDPFLEAMQYAEDNSLFVISLGDLVDGGDYPQQVAQFLKDKMDDESAALAIGNHDSKFYRYGLGNPVKIGPEQARTLEMVHEKDFVRLMSLLHQHHYSNHYMYFGRTTFAHASVHRSLWEQPETLNSMQLAKCMFGDTCNLLDEKGWPTRTYGWIDDIPSGYNTVTGHDRLSLGKASDKPLVIRNHQGGVAYLTDTGCGKVADHPLNGTVFSICKGELLFIKFKAFR